MQNHWIRIHIYAHAHFTLMHKHTQHWQLPMDHEFVHMSTTTNFHDGTLEQFYMLLD